MKLYLKSERSSQVAYTSHEGMPETTVRDLMTAIGYENIEVITEAEYLAQIVPQN